MHHLKIIDVNLKISTEARGRDSAYERGGVEFDRPGERSPE